MHAPIASVPLLHAFPEHTNNEDVVRSSAKPTNGNPDESDVHGCAKT